MFITERRHRTEVAVLQDSIREREAAIAELERQLEAERIGGHDIIEAVRYTLTDAAGLLRDKSGAAGGSLHNLAESLPYVLSGCHQWPNRHSLATVPNGRSAAERVARDHGIDLPAEPKAAVKILLEIASVLMCPERSEQLDYYRTPRQRAAQ